MSRNLLTLTIGKQKNIALIAHDAKKEELISWCDEHKELLSKHFLCGTGTTARMITDRTGLPVKGYNSGPLGGGFCVLCAAQLGLPVLYRLGHLGPAVFPDGCDEGFSAGGAV